MNTVVLKQHAVQKEFDICFVYFPNIVILLQNDIKTLSLLNIGELVGEYSFISSKQNILYNHFICYQNFVTFFSVLSRLLVLTTFLVSASLSYRQTDCVWNMDILLSGCVKAVRKDLSGL